MKPDLKLKKRIIELLKGFDKENYTHDGKNYLVLDNFLDPEQANAIERHFYGNQMQWYMTQNTSGVRKDEFLTVTEDHYHMYKRKAVNIKEGPQLNHYFFDKRGELGNTVPVSNYVIPVTDLLKVLCMKSGIDAFKVVRIKANMKMQVTGFTEKNYNTPHKDEEDHHIVAIYYVNESDGDTRLFANKPGEEAGIVVPDLSKPSASIRPKKNRLLIFNGETWHAASHPVKSQTRCVINMDISCSPQLLKDEQ